MRNARQSIQTLAMLLILTLFVTGAGFVVFYGAKTYASITRQGKADTEVRTVTLYLNNRIKQNDEINRIALIEDNGISVLQITQNQDTEYYTSLFFKEGILYELTGIDKTVNSDGASKIVKLKAFTMSLKKNDDLYFTFTDSIGRTHNLTVATMSVR